MATWLTSITAIAPMQRWVARREIRQASGREIHKACVTINFALLQLLQDKKSEEAVRREFFPSRFTIVSIDEFFKIKPAEVMSLPEWQQVKHWSNELAMLSRKAEHPLAFRMIEMLGSLTIEPMKRCVSREARRFAERILERPEVVKYRTDYYSEWAARRRTGA